jgi:hypothetical protein
VLLCCVCACVMSHSSETPVLVLNSVTTATSTCHVRLGALVPRFVRSFVRLFVCGVVGCQVVRNVNAVVREGHASIAGTAWPGRGRRRRLHEKRQ